MSDEIHARLGVERGEFTLDVDLTLPGRGISALFGHSGSGKTTCLRAMADHKAGHRVGELASYLACERRERDLATLVLADLSMSTDAWVDNEARVIDVIKDSLMLFSEALAAIGDRFALYGFSSRRRDHIRFSRIKDFAEHHGPNVLGRIHALRPGYYTRMGASIRQALDRCALINIRTGDFVTLV